MPGIFLFTGENSYQLREEKRRWMQEFMRKHGTDNLIRIEGEKLAMRSLLDEVSVAPFLAEKRLVIVEGAPKWSKEDVDVLGKNIHPQVLLLIVATSLDKRTSGAKELMKTAETKEFLPLKGKGLERWVEQRATAEGTPVDGDALSLIIEYVGEEQDLLDQEIAKLSLYASTRTGRITRADVEEIVLPTDEGIIWKMTDMISAGRKNDAFSYATRMIDRGGDPYGMWAVLLSMLKNVINVRGAAQDGGSDPKDIGQEIGLHFFAVRSLLPYARRVKEGALSRHLETTVSSDIALKTGGYKATDEAPEELLALIDRFILTCP